MSRLFKAFKTHNPRWISYKETPNPRKSPKELELLGLRGLKPCLIAGNIDGPAYPDGGKCLYPGEENKEEGLAYNGCIRNCFFRDEITFFYSIWLKPSLLGT
jgi:hypothetical protein